MEKSKYTPKFIYKGYRNNLLILVDLDYNKSMYLIKVVKNETKI